MKNNHECKAGKTCKEERTPYNERSREDWIDWARKEIEEYEKFIKFLEK